MITYKNDSQDINLPKWPAMTVIGDKVTSDQAAEIIIRTDYSLPFFKHCSNSSELEQELSNIFKIPNDDSKICYGENSKMQKFLKKINKIDLNVLHTSRILTCSIEGPHGWIDWSGNIFMNTMNIGKHPSVQSVAEDWHEIIKAFPYLKLKSQLYNGEVCEENSEPVVEFNVSDGNVIVDVVTDSKNQLLPLVDNVTDNIHRLLMPSHIRESGITTKQLISKLNIVYNNEIPQYS